MSSACLRKHSKIVTLRMFILLCISDSPSADRPGATFAQTVGQGYRFLWLRAGLTANFCSSKSFVNPILYPASCILLHPCPGLRTVAIEDAWNNQLVGAYCQYFYPFWLLTPACDCYTAEVGSNYHFIVHWPAAVWVAGWANRGICKSACHRSAADYSL